MPQEVILPRVDMDMAEGKIAKWLVEEGKNVTAGQPLFEIETDKAAMEIEAPATGILRHILAKPGESRPVGLPVAYIFAEGEADVRPASAVLPSLTATEPGAKIEITLPPLTQESANGVRATPLARRLARERGIKLDALAGSGPRGRIVAADVPEKVQALAAESKPAADVRHLYDDGAYTAAPVTGMRATIARRLTESWSSVPHFMLTLSCTVERLEDIRTRLNGQAPRNSGNEPLWKLSINDFIVKAYGLALQRVPDANVTWAGDSILKHKASDIAVAIAVPGGLFVPVVRSVETKSLSQISLEIRSLSARAKEGKLTPADYRGGTGAVSNLGMFGIEQFNAIINPPQATILAVGAVTELAKRGPAGIAFERRINCTLSCDHRAVDGALAAQFLAALKSLIEEPGLMLA
jgi:pyruvate dehydrogenase E2 component (dihydrolipoamide acetyltransferase)